MRTRVFVLLVCAVVVAGSVGTVSFAQEENAELAAPTEDPGALAQEIVAKEKELQALAGKIGELKQAREQKVGEKRRLTTAVEILEDRVRQSRLELDHTRLSIEEVRLRVRQTQEELALLLRKQGRVRDHLHEIFRELARYDRRSPLEVVFGGGTFADFVGSRQAIGRLQATLTTLLTQTQDLRRAREARESELKSRSEELLQLSQLQEAQRASLHAEEGRQRGALAVKTAEAARVASQLAEAQEARREIEQEIFVLKNAGLRLSLKQAEDYARYAGGVTGVRPALLLGVLKVESNVGTNVGSGRYPDDVHPDHREAFVRVTAKLGLNTATAPVSAKPKTYAGWGGAMGPGQIMPGIWEHLEPEVARLTGKPRPSPYDLLDAFVATAVYLKNSGAAAGNEYEAVNRYFAGPNWQRFTWYGDRVLAVAKEYESRGQ